MLVEPGHDACHRRWLTGDNNLYNDSVNIYTIKNYII